MCYECSKEDFDDKASFMTAARASHKKFNTERKIRADRVKDVLFKDRFNMMAAIVKHTGGGSRNLIRKATVNFIQLVAYAIAADVSEDPEMKAFTQEKVQQYYDTVQEQSRGGSTFGTCSVDGSVLSAKDIGYLTFVSKRVGLCWLCRHCGWAGWNHLWYKRPNHEHFKCPACSVKYSPWKTTGGTKTEGNRAVVYPDANGRTQVSVVAWPSSAEDRFFNQMIEKHAQQVLGEIRDADAWTADSVNKLSEYARKKGTPTGWKRYDWRTHLNFEPYERPQAEYFEGVEVPNLETAQVEKDFDVLIALLGNVLGGVKAKQRGSK